MSVGVAMANYAGTRWGRSAAYHPRVFIEDGQTVDPIVVEADESEGIWLAEFDLDALQSIRPSFALSCMAAIANSAVHDTICRCSVCN